MSMPYGLPIQDVPDAGRVWAALCDVRQQTGLVPFLPAGMDGATTQPWDSAEFEPPPTPPHLITSTPLTC